MIATSGFLTALECTKFVYDVLQLLDGPDTHLELLSARLCGRHVPATTYPRPPTPPPSTSGPTTSRRHVVVVVVWLDVHRRHCQLDHLINRSWGSLQLTLSQTP